MKKIGLTLLSVILLNCCYAQEILFKIKYLPNHNYDVSGNTTINIKTDLSKVQKLVDALAKQGITQPVNAVMNMQTAGTINSGAPGADGGFPFIMNFSVPNMNVNVNGKQIPIPSNPASKFRMYGKVGSDSKVSIDSLNGQKTTDSASAKAATMLNSMFRMINFPEHPLKPGESFTQDAPLNLPIPGLNLNYKVTYKLISIDGNKANFDIILDMTMQMNVKGKVNLVMTGGGTGKMVYDIKDSFPLSYSSDATMKINVKTDQFDIDGDMMMKGTQTYVITSK